MSTSLSTGPQSSTSFSKPGHAAGISLVGLACLLAAVLVNIPLLIACSRLPTEHWPTLLRHAPNQFIFLLIVFPILLWSLHRSQRLALASGLIGRRLMFSMFITAMVAACFIGLTDHQADKPDWHVRPPPLMQELAAEQAAIHTWIDQQASLPLRKDLLSSTWYANKQILAADHRQPTTLLLEAAHSLDTPIEKWMYRFEGLELVVSLLVILYWAFLLTAINVAGLWHSKNSQASHHLYRQMTLPVACFIIGGSIFTFTRAINIWDIELVKSEVTAIPPGIMMVGVFVCGWQMILARVVGMRRIDSGALCLVAIMTTTSIACIVTEMVLPGFLGGKNGIISQRTGIACMILAVACLLESAIALLLGLSKTDQASVATA